MIATASRQEQFEAVLRRHGAELSRLRGSRGLVRCVLPGHDDRSASLSLDLTAAVFNCFGCGRSGGLKALLELLGEGHSTPARRAQPETEIQRARRAVMQRERARIARAARAEIEYALAASGWSGPLCAVSVDDVIAPGPRKSEPHLFHVGQLGSRVRDSVDGQAKIESTIAAYRDWCAERGIAWSCEARQ